MERTNQVKIQIQGTKGKSEATAGLRVFTKKEAFRKGLSWCLILWGIGLVTLPIPIVHFLSVPSCLLFGPVAGLIGYKLYNGATDIEEFTANCPDCGQKIMIAARPTKWPFEYVCYSCQSKLSLNQITS